MGDLVHFTGRSVESEVRASVLTQLASAKRFESFTNLKTRLELLVSEAVGSGDLALVEAVENWSIDFQLDVSKKRREMEPPE